jgi:coenzyme Q-binding protein COQ10
LHKFQISRRVPFSAEQMFAVVADIESYPEFLPLCESLTVRSRETRGAETELVATMAIGYHKIAESFTSRVRLRPVEGQILVDYLDGPFSYLENSWSFRDVAGGSDINFFIKYEFRSKMLSLLMGTVFDKAVRKFTNAFEERARELYAKPAPRAQTAEPSK